MQGENVVIHFGTPGRVPVEPDEMVNIATSSCLCVGRQTGCLGSFRTQRIDYRYGFFAVVFFWHTVVA